MAGAGVAGDRDLLVELWNAEPSARQDGVALSHLLLASEELLRLTVPRAGAADRAPADDARESPADPCRRILRVLNGLLRAERAFLLEVRPVAPPGGSRIGEALASADLDGEPVAQAAGKVPLAALAGILESGVPDTGGASDPSAAPEGADGGPSCGRYVALPVEWSGELRAVVYLENRFRPIDMRRETLRVARAHCRLLGCILSWQRLRLDHEALWADLERLREEQPPEPVHAVPRSREAPRRSRRSDLKGDYSAIVGSSPCMLEIFRLLDRISGSSASVLINGESGTGKELIAHAVHRNSPRRDAAFVSENCGAITETLLESELFGYVKGAFTGAGKDHKGLFEHAEGGTLFLDEVGDMSAGMQKKLLRVLQEGVIRRVGGKDYIPVNVRVLSATNKDLLEEVRAGNFREDLYYRLNVINLRIPPLRERKEDIPELVDAFLADLARETGIARRIEPAAVERLAAHAWPGNIRELKNELKRVYAMADGDIRLHDLSEAVIAGEERDRPFKSLGSEILQLTLKDATERLEREMIRHAIIQSRGNKSLVAKMLQVPKTSLYNKINKYGLEKL